jgi:hypothetical protein
MPGTRTTAIAIRTETVLARPLAWAKDTAQEFGGLVSALMGPAVVSAYALTAWSLAANIGWTNTFMFNKGPLSNWLIWLGIAILVNLAASILRRRSQQ